MIGNRLDRAGMTRSIFLGVAAFAVTLLALIGQQALAGAALG